MTIPPTVHSEVNRIFYFKAIGGCKRINQTTGKKKKLKELGNIFPSQKTTHFKIPS